MMRRLGAGLGIGLAASVVSLLIHEAGLFQSAETQALNLWLQLRKPTRVSSRIALVFVDDLAVRTSGELPWDARQYAKLIARLKQARAHVIVLDVFSIAARAGFRDPAKVREFTREMEAARNVVLPMELSLQTLDDTHPPPRRLHRFACASEDQVPPSFSYRSIVAPPDEVIRAAAGLGYVNVVTDRNNVVRRFPHVGEYQRAQYPSLALAAWNVFNGGSAEVQLGAGGKVIAPREELTLDPHYELLLDPVGEAVGEGRGWQYVSAREVLTGTVGNELQGKAVIVGVTAIGTQKMFTIAPDRQVYDLELQALALDNLLEHRYLKPAGTINNAALIIGAGMLSASLSVLVSPLFGASAALIVSFLVLLFGHYELAHSRWWIHSATAASNVSLAYLFSLAWRLYQREQEDARIRAAIETLREVSDIVAAETDSRKLLESIMQAMVTVLRAEAGSILLVDNETRRLRFEVTLGTRAGQVQQLTLAMGEGIAGWVAEHEQAVISNNVAHDPRFRMEIAHQLQFPTRTIMAAPLKAKDRLFGVVEVINKRSSERFTAGDLQLLQTVANEAALALENARLYGLLQERVEETHRELLATNQRLETERKQLGSIVTNLRDGVVVTDVQGNVMIFNKAAMRMLRVTARAPLSVPLREVISESELLELFERARPREAGVISDQLRFENGPIRVISVHLSAVRDEQGEVFGTVCVLNDITELKTLEKLKDDFVSFVSHELRSPLTSIRGFASALVRGDADAATRDRYLSIIRDESERMTRLIVSLLDLSRIESGEALELNPEPIRMAQVVHDVVERQKSYARGHELHVAVSNELPVVTADRDKVQQILTNLVTNAIKYSPEGSPIEIGCYQQNGEVVAYVKDEGVGINPEDRDKIFQRFQRIRTGTGTQATGTGLGLYLTRHLVEAHDGRIWVDSAPGRGSRFCFSLPLRRGGV